MANSIATSNEKNQGEIFLPAIHKDFKGLVQCGMGKRPKPQTRDIFLGAWLDHFGLSRSEAARIAGCGQPYISNIVSGSRKNVNALYLLRLSEHLEVSVNDFYRRPPSKAEINALANLSPRAQTAILNPKPRKAG